MEHTITRNEYIVDAWELISLARDKPSERRRISKFTDILDTEIWTPITTPRESMFKSDRIAKSNLMYPIIVDKDTNDVYDGVHRLAKAVMKGRTFIQVKEVTFEEFKNLAKDKRSL